MSEIILADPAIAELRATNVANLTHLATIRKPGPMVNGRPSAPVIVDSDVPCRMRPAATVSERVVAGSLDAPARYTLTFHVGTVVGIDYTMTVTGDEDGALFMRTVKVVGDADGGIGRTMRKVLVEVVG